jgi:predicted permease
MIRDLLHQDVRYAMRGLLARPAFAASVIATIALGMGASATMFGIIDRLLFHGPDLIHDPDSVVLIETRQAGSPYAGLSFSYAAYTDYRDHPGSFAAVAASWTRSSVPLGRGRDATRVSGSLVSAGFFSLLGVRPRLGRFFTADEDNEHDPHNVAVISEGFWRRRFGGSAGVLTQTLEIGPDHYRIVGVAPAGFTGIELKNVDVWLPIVAAAGLRFDSSPTWTTNRNNTWLAIVARLAPGTNARLAAEQATAVDRAALRQRIAAEPKVAKYIKPDSESVALVPIVPGRVPAGLGSTIPSDDVKVSKLLGIVSLIVLVIACANVANLLLLRGLNRRREVAVMLALGVSAPRLIRQLVVEALILAAAGGAAALLIAQWTSAGLRTLLLGEDAWTTSAIDGRLLAFTGVMTILTALATSLVPALATTRTDVAIALKAGVREGGARHSPMRTALLVVQASLAIALLAGAGLFVRSIKNVDAVPFGVDVNHVIVADINHKAAGLTNHDAHRLFEQFASNVARVRGVKAAAVTIGLPFGLNWGTDLFVPGHAPPPPNGQSPGQYAVTPGYFAALGIRLLAGREFSPGDREGTAPVIIISDKTASLYFPHENPVGKCAKVGQGASTPAADTIPCSIVIGVVANTIRQGIEDVVPQVYRPLAQLPETYTDRTISFFGYELVARTFTDASRYVEPVRRAMQSAGTSVPYANVRPMRDLLGARIRVWELGSRVFSALGLLALVLAAVGLYSVLSFSIAQRRHEIGVRVALGAQSVDIVLLAVVQGLAPIVAGIAFGLALTLVSGKFVESLLFKVSPRDPSVLAGACAVLFGTALLASLVPAFRAVRIDPAAVLRAD